MYNVITLKIYLVNTKSLNCIQLNITDCIVNLSDLICIIRVEPLFNLCYVLLIRNLLYIFYSDYF